jgi:hypothetical protein
MSIQFSDTINYKGLVQIYEKEIGAERGFVSGHTNRLKEFTADVNLAWDDYLTIAIKSSGRYQFDDSNHSDYPIITTNLVAGQRDYPFTTDESGNLILDIHRVTVLPSATATLYQDIFPVDSQSDEYVGGLVENNTAQGVPYVYDKTANGIFLDPIPSYSVNAGLRIYISREASYFTSSDTTKKPGCPGVHHRYFALKPALDYARRNSLATYPIIREEVVSFEGDEEKGVIGSIERYFSRRSRDERPRITPRLELYL